MGALAKLVAQDAKTARRIAEFRGGLLRGDSLHEVSSERLVLPVGGVGRNEECPLDVC